jgi:DNA-binding response OmpR family regulator
MSEQRRRVLVVEDEMMIAMMIEDLLAEIGCEVIGPANRIDAALALVDSDIDVALLDVNLAGQVVYPVADRLRARGVPVIFLTGYGNVGVDPRYRDCPVLTKPFELTGLQAALAKVPPGVAKS